MNIKRMIAAVLASRVVKHPFAFAGVNCFSPISYHSPYPLIIYFSDYSLR